MRTSTISFGIAGAAGAALLGASLAALAKDPEQSVPLAYTAELSGEFEVPPVTTGGSGTAQITLDPGTNLLTWEVTYDGLSGPATAAHFHGPAGPGENAGVVLPLGEVVTSPIMGQASVTEEQEQEIINGLWYVNIHTEANPGGEIRGQVVAAEGENVEALGAPPVGDAARNE